MSYLSKILNRLGGLVICLFWPKRRDKTHRRFTGPPTLPHSFLVSQNPIPMRNVKWAVCVFVPSFWSQKDKYTHTRPPRHSNPLLFMRDRWHLHTAFTGTDAHTEPGYDSEHGRLIRKLRLPVNYPGSSDSWAMAVYPSRGATSLQSHFSHDSLLCLYDLGISGLNIPLIQSNRSLQLKNMISW